MIRPRRKNIEDQTERKAIQAENIRALKDAWFKLLIGFDYQRKEGRAEVEDLKADFPGSDHHFSLDFSVQDFNPTGNINTDLATLTLRGRYVDKGRLQFPLLASLEISGSLDERGRVGLDIRHTRTEVGHEGKGYGQALMSAMNEAIPLLLKLFEKQWKGKTVYVIQTDMAGPADKRAGHTRQGWTRVQAEQLGFTDNVPYIRKYLGDDFLPLPKNTLVRVYKQAKP